MIPPTIAPMTNRARRSKRASHSTHSAPNTRLAPRRGTGNSGDSRSRGSGPAYLAASPRPSSTRRSRPSCDLWRRAHSPPSPSCGRPVRARSSHAARRVECRELRQVVSIEVLGLLHHRLCTEIRQVAAQVLDLPASFDPSWKRSQVELVEPKLFCAMPPGQAQDTFCRSVSSVTGV